MNGLRGMNLNITIERLEKVAALLHSGPRLVVFLAPVFWMISSSPETLYQIFAVPPVWWPNPPRW